MPEPVGFADESVRAARLVLMRRGNKRQRVLNRFTVEGTVDLRHPAISGCL